MMMRILGCLGFLSCFGLLVLDWGFTASDTGVAGFDEPITLPRPPAANNWSASRLVMNEDMSFSHQRPFFSIKLPQAPMVVFLWKWRAIVWTDPIRPYLLVLVKAIFLPIALNRQIDYKTFDPFAECNKIFSVGNCAKHALEEAALPFGIDVSLVLRLLSVVA